MTDSIPQKLKILILAVHFEVTGARYITDAFKRLGHDVRHVGPQARLKDAWGVDIAAGYDWVPDLLPEITLSGIPVIGWQPDLIVIADTLTPDYAIPNNMRHIPVVAWSQDNHVRDMRLLNSEGLIQHYFLAHAHGKAQPVTQADETWLPCGYDPVAFKPSRIPWNEREYDVAIVGVMYPRRAKLVEMMREAGLKVFAATGLVYDEYAAAYQNSRISLCTSIDGDLAQRVFETAAMDCTILTDYLDDLSDEETNHQLGLAGFFVYRSDEEAVRMAQALVGDERAMAQAGAQIMQDIVLTGHKWSKNAEGMMYREKMGVWDNHSWDARCRVIADWFEDTYGDKMVNGVKPTQVLLYPTPEHPIEELKEAADKLINLKAYLNLGCGKTHFPSAKPAGHELVDDSVYSYPLFLNVDKVDNVGADMVFDLFTYPWPIPDDSFDGAIAGHLIEHIPHEIKLSDDSDRAKELAQMQDGWSCWWSELYRVLTPNSLVHVVSPYGFSDGGIVDFSHTRYLTINSFTHSMTPEISDGSTFKYNNGGINFQIEGQPVYRFTPYAELMHQRTGFPMDVLIGTFLNMVYDFKITLKCVK